MISLRRKLLAERRQSPVPARALWGLNNIHIVRQQIISGDNIYQFLLYCDKLYDKFDDAEKKEFLNRLMERLICTGKSSRK